MNELNEKDIQLSPEVAAYKLQSEEREKQKIKKKINTGLRAIGLVGLFFIAWQTFDVLFEISWFGRIFNKALYIDTWYTLQHAIIDGGSPVFDNTLLWGKWLPVTILTGVLIMMVIGLGYVLAFNIRDVIATVKEFFGFGGNVTRELTDELKNVVDETGITSLGDKIKAPFKKKSKKLLFPNTDDKKIEKLKKSLETTDNHKSDVIDNSVVKEEPKITTIKKELSNKDMNKKIDAILNDQNLTYDEAQKAVNDLQNNTVISEKKLF